MDLQAESQKTAQPKLFLSDELLDMIVEETNRYASLGVARKPDPKWHDTSREEMQVFFGLHVLFGYYNRTS